MGYRDDGQDAAGAIVKSSTVARKYGIMRLFSKKLKSKSFESRLVAKIRDAYPRLLLARTRQPEYDYEGLRIVNLADWLANAG